MKTCPFCAEEIQEAAIVSKHFANVAPQLTPRLGPFVVLKH